MIKIKDMDLNADKRELATNITMELERGGKYILLGQNGTGKSTFMKEIFKASIIGGEGIDIDNSNAFYSDNSSLTAFDQFSGFEYLNTYFEPIYGYEWFKEKIIDLSKFEVDNKVLGTTMADLSGGERRILNVLVAIYGKYDLLLIDELESNLDEVKLEKAIDEINKMEECTIIIATHNQKVVNKLHHNKVFMFKEQKLEEANNDNGDGESLKELFQKEKGLIDENFEF
ncbi:ABC transporter ATP-binding protein [Mycoplasma todarodis]|uniref:ATP-binding cassette domain-containing protein n=1 Tax=Mycoplasma todarodis TaxID=1937191 RepID=UPI003B38C458